MTQASESLPSGADDGQLGLIVAKLDALLERQSAPAPRFLTVGGAARYCSLSADSVRRLCERGELTAHRPISGRVLIDRRQLDDLILGSTRRPASGRGRRRVKSRNGEQGG